MRNIKTPLYRSFIVWAGTIALYVLLTASCSSNGRADMDSREARLSHNLAVAASQIDGGCTLLDLATGEPVECDTDSDCLMKTGVDFSELDQ